MTGGRATAPRSCSPSRTPPAREFPKWAASRLVDHRYPAPDAHRPKGTSPECFHLMRRFVVPAMDIGQCRSKVEPGHRLGMAAVHVSGCAVVVDAFADAGRDPAVWPEASPADSRHRICLLVCCLLIFLAGSEKHSAELLNRHPQLALKHHWVWQVPPVEPHEFDRR